MLTHFTSNHRLSVSPAQVEEDMAYICQDFGVTPDRVTQATPEEDHRLGVDFWIHRPDGTRFGVDVMHRREGTVKHWKGGPPQLAIEIVSRLEDNAPSKFARTGAEPAYYLFCFDELPGVRYVIPGPQLRDAFQAGKFAAFPVCRSHTTREGGAWSTPFYPVPVPAMAAIVPVYLVGEVNELLAAARHA